MTAFEVFSQQVINGFTTGSYLALIALGYTMVYGLIELINFAHGDIYALGFFFSLTLFTWLGVPRTLVASLPASTLVWMLPGVMLLTMSKRVGCTTCAPCSGIACRSPRPRTCRSGYCTVNQ